MTTTDRTFAVFDTDAFRAGDVYDETFHAHARAIMEPLRERLIASGRGASAVEAHSFYGVAFSVEDPESGRVLLLLQAVGPWLLTLTRELTWLARIRGAKESEADQALVSAVDAALTDIGVGSRSWLTPDAYERAAREQGPIKTNRSS